MKRNIFVFTLLAAWLGMVASPGKAAGLIIIENLDRAPIEPRPIPEPWAPPYHRVYRFAPLEVDYNKVNVRISDQVAYTSIDEEFYNPNPQRLEGTFVFPVPKGAQIDKFTMEIDGKQVQAELLPSDKARGIYEDIVRRMKDPALMEYAGQDVFKVRIFPIEPNSKKRITLAYTQVLKLDSGLANYVFPLNTAKYSSKPIKNVSVKVDLESKRPLKSIYSPSHTVEIHRDGANKATVGYEACDVKPDSDFQLYFAPEKDEIGMNLMTYRTGGEDGYFLLLASPGLDVKEKQVSLKDVVFVLDTSGSMAGGKLKQAKKALQFCVENLNDGDRFEVIRFSTEVEPLFGELADASEKNRAKAGDFIKDLKAMGATAIDDALRKALSLEGGKDGRPFVVIFLTDGLPTIGDTDENHIVSNVKQSGKGNRRVFCFGIGTDVNTHLLDRIAEETRAFSQYVLPEEDIEVKVSNFYAKIKDPVLANPELKFTGDIHASKFYPSPLPDLFKGEQLVLVGRYSGKGDSAVVIEGMVNGEKKKLTYEVKFPAESSEHEFIPRLWATRRVGYLMDEIRLHGENPELRDEVTELARKNGIVTPYTAYLIMEDESRRGVTSSLQSLPQLQRDVQAREEAGKNYFRYKTDKDGDGAVAGSRYGLALKSADSASAAINGVEVESLRTLAPAGESQAFSRRYGRFPGAGTTSPAQTADAASLAAPESAQGRLVEYTQQTQFVAGKNFFQNAGQWIDSQAQKLPDAKRVRVQFGSADYFDLLKKHPETAPWLAMGTQVQFVLDNAIYEIYDENTAGQK